MSVESKICTGCGLTKSLDQFNKNIRGKLGRQPKCKRCEKQSYDTRYTGGRILEDKKAAKADSTTKRCRCCDRRLPIDSFHKSQKGLLRRKSICKDCTSQRDRRGDRLKSKYDLSLNDFERMLSEQDGKCAICRSSKHHGVNFVVDHDHITGRVRALLCNKCNPALGLMGDDPNRLLAAAEYLRKHSHAPHRHTNANH